MTIHEYAKIVQDSLVNYYSWNLVNNANSNEEETIEKLTKVLIENLADYYSRNISPEMAAELIANKLDLIENKKIN